MLRQKIISAFIVVIILTVFAGQCNAGEPLVFGGVSDIHPLAFEENNEVKGFLTDVFLEVARRSGYNNATVRLYPFKRLNKYLKEGRVDGTVSIFYKKERESYLIYSKSPVLISRTLAFVKKGREFSFDSINDLYGKTVGMLSGWTVHNVELEKAINEGKIKTDKTTRLEENVKKLMLNRFDCLISTEQITWYHINVLGFSGDIVALDKAITENKTYLALSKKSKNIPDPLKFIDTLNNALDTVLTDGTHKKIQKKYQVRSLQ